MEYSPAPNRTEIFSSQHNSVIIVVKFILSIPAEDSAVFSLHLLVSTQNQ